MIKVCLCVIHIFLSALGVLTELAALLLLSVLGFALLVSQAAPHVCYCLLCVSVFIYVDCVCCSASSSLRDCPAGSDSQVAAMDDVDFLSRAISLLLCLILI